MRIKFKLEIITVHVMAQSASPFDGAACWKRVPPRLPPVWIKSQRIIRTILVVYACDASGNLKQKKPEYYKGEEAHLYDAEHFGADVELQHVLHAVAERDY